MKRFAGSAALLALMFAPMTVPTCALAQAFPNRLVKVVVPYTPGSLTDAAARGVAQRLSEMWGQPVVIENRPGAGTTMGAEHVAKAAPDGYTLLFADHPTYVIVPHLFSNLSYSPLTDFAPITIVFRTYPVFALANAVPAKTFKEFLAYARANPGKLSYASFGNGSFPHVATEQLKRMAAIDLVHVPYKGGAPAITDLLGGRVALLMASYGTFAQAEKAGKVKIIAAATEKRIAVRPDLPTVSESGVPGYSISVWFAMAAPGGTPPAVLDRIHADVVKILRDPGPDGFNEKFMKPQSVEPGGYSRAEFASIIRTEYAQWGRLVRAIGVKLD
ncbi:MAG: tripartite tricarboxylate transporter substrate binding protein [Betaproteobacteria bacterium]|nr:tripartite tricarboxylate transporter substrate binding protein [Betaproteobacteria bacterium]MBI2958982.1 tripartite tricarboxylate transporter substrate binding protein [Betaproteobacteria bacterium]